MEVESDLCKITNEELLRKMWQQSEDSNRKKEIRSQLYKLRDSRLRNLYQGDIMADNSLAGFGKDPLVTSHGDALADQSFQSLKSKEIRDSLSPTEMKFQSMALNNPNTTGWNVQSAKEISPDGRGFRAETVATTDGVENINGGIAEFKGRNEERSSAHHQGDDKNFVKKAMESSNSHLQEKVVIGDENSGRTEVRTSSSTSTSSSQVIQSSTNVEYEDGYPIQQQPHAQKYLIDSKGLNQHQQQEQQRLLEEQRIYEQQFEQQHQQHLTQQERRATEQVSTKRQNIEQKNISQNIETQETHEQNKRYVDMDKASPEYQQHVQYLMQQPGEIISSTVEYPKPNVKMITTVKRLPDGTIVRNKRYETEELSPNTNTTRPTATPTNQTHPRRDSQQQQHQPKTNYQPNSSPHSKPSQDMVDSSNSRYIQDTHTEDVETKFSSIKKSSNKFSTETTSETIQEEFDEHHPQGRPSSRPKPKSNDFSTHGFPSVRANKPTQEYPSERPRAAHPTQGYPSQASPSRPTEFDTPHNIDNTDNITERRINTKDGEVIIISSEKKHNFKTSTNSERIVETEHVIHEDQPYRQIPDKRTQDITTHGFPSAREPSSHQPKNYPNEKQMQPQEQDFPLDKLAPGTRIIKGVHSPHGDDEVVIVSSQKSHTAKHSSNTERVIAHEIIRDGQQVGYPQTDNGAPYNYTVTTPGDQTPQVEILGSPRKPSNADYSTQGFPSVRNPNYAKPGERGPLGDHPAETSRRPNNEYSPEKIPSRPAAGLPSSHNQHPNSPRKSPGHDYSPQGYPSVRSPSRGTPTQTCPTNVDGRRTPSTAEQPKTPTSGKVQPRTPSPNKYKTGNTTVRETTERVIKKEKEVDSAHRAFAASLRSSSPIDHIRRDSYTTDSHTRHTPRSSVSSTRTFRRDMREGSHDSAPSETSRFSTTTITRNTPPRTVGGRTVTTKVVTNKSGPGSRDSLNVTSPRATKSPSPGKNVTTTTSTTTTTTRTLNRDVPKVTDNQPIRNTSNKIDTIFPINESPPPPLPLTSITKIKFSDNDRQQRLATKSKNNNSKKNMPVVNDFNASASAGVEEVIEAPCLKKNYYKLGPSDQTQEQLHPKKSHSLKSPQINEKSPVKKQSSQPAPNSRSSTPSYNSSSKPPPKSVMANDYDDDDDDNLNTTSPFSQPSSRSRTPQNAPTGNDKPQDNWQMPSRQPDNDERRTVNRETTFEKTTNESIQPRKPNFEQPNVEWVIVDDDDDYHDDHDHDDYDNDSFTPEVVDAKLNVKTTTTKLITQEKKSPVVPQRVTKPTTTTTRTTITSKQFPNVPSKSPTKPYDKSPLKTKPNDNRTPQPVRTPKPLTDSKSPMHTPSKFPTKVVDNKLLPKGPKSIGTANTSPLRKPLPKTTTEETTLRRTLKTSQVLKEKTNKLIEAEKPKRKPQSPERIMKPPTPIKRKPNDVEKDEIIVVTEITERGLTGRKSPQPGYVTARPHDNDCEPIQDRPIYEQEHTPQASPDNRQFPTDDRKSLEVAPDFRKPQDNDLEPQQIFPAYRKPQKDDDNEEIPTCRKPEGISYEPKPGSPNFKRPVHINEETINYSGGIQIPPDTDNKPKIKSPVFRKPPSSGFQKLQSTFDEGSSQYRKPYSVDDEPHQNPSVVGNLPDTYIKPGDTNEKPIVDTLIKQQSQKMLVEEQVTIAETSQEIYPERVAPKRPDNEPIHQQSPQDGIPGYMRPKFINEPKQGLPNYRNSTNFEPNQDKKYPQKMFEEEITIVEKYEKGVPENKVPQRRQHSPENKTVHLTSTSEKQYEIDEKRKENKICIDNRGKPVESDEEPESPKPEFEPSKTYDDADDDDGCLTEGENIVISSQKTVAKHIQKFETNFLKNKSPKPESATKSPIKQPIQKKLPKTPVVKEATGSKSPKRIISPSRAQKEPENSKHVSPIRIQKHPEQKSLMEPANRRPKSPSKPAGKKPNEEMPFDEEYITINSKTTKVVTEKLIEDFDDEEYPEYPEYKPKVQKSKTGKPLDMDGDDDDNEFLTSSTQKIVKIDKITSKFEEPLHPERKSPQVRPAQIPNKPEQKPNEKIPGRRAQSPTKPVSPLRTSDNNQTFRKTLNTEEDKTTRKFVDKNYPAEKNPSGKVVKPETKPKGDKPQTSDTEDEEEIFTETNEFVIKSSQKQFVTEQEIKEFEKSSKSPTRRQSKPIEKLPEDKLKQPISKRPQSPNKNVSPTRILKKSEKEITSEDDETFTTSFATTQIVKEQIIKKENEQKVLKPGHKSPTRQTTKIRSQSPNKSPSPTRNQMRHVTTRNYVTENTTKDVELKPKDKPKDRKPHYANATDNEDDETLTLTSERFVSSKTCKITDRSLEPQYPSRDDLAPQQIPEHKFPQEPEVKHPTGKKPETEIFKMKATKTVTENTTQNVDLEQYPTDRKPADNLKDKTLTSRTVTENEVHEFEKSKSPTRGYSPKRTSRQPQSPTRTQTKPNQIIPQDDKKFTKPQNVSKEIVIEEFSRQEEPNKETKFDKPGFMEPQEKRPKSPQKEVSVTRTQKFEENDQTFRKTLKTTQTVVEKSTEDTTEHEEHPLESKPKLYEPTETDKDESFIETAEFVLKSTNKPKYPGLTEPAEKPQHLRPDFDETNYDESFNHTNEFIRNTTQKLITNEQIFETEQDLYFADKTRQPKKDTSPKRSYSPPGKKIPETPTETPQYPGDRKQSPTRNLSPKTDKNGPKPVTVDDETFKKSLRNDKDKPKEQQHQLDLLKHPDRDEDESDNETEDLVIETCEKNYVIERNFISRKEQEPKAQKPNEKKPEDTKIENPLTKPFDSTCVETIETIEGQTYPEDTEQFPVTGKHPKNKMPLKEKQEPQKPTQTSKYSMNVNEQFIETERLHKETPDGGFISKTLEPSSPTSPTFKKKGAGRSDTFEERCRQILGMDTYGDTPGVYKKQSITENEEQEERKDLKEIPEKTTVFQVKVEDCDEDDEALSVSSVKKTLHKQIHTTEQTLKEETKGVREPAEKPQSKTPRDKFHSEEKFTTTLEKEADKPQKEPTEPKLKDSVEPIKPKYPQGGKNEFAQITTETTTVHRKTTQNKPDAETETDFSEPELLGEKFVKETKIIKKPSRTPSPRSSSPTKSLSSPRSLSPNKATLTPKNDTPKRKPKTDSIRKLPQSNNDATTIKDRLRSSTRKTKSPSKPDQVDGSESESPEHSPTRYTEQRRSSNISVTTEIIIEHTDSDAANKKEKSPPPIVTTSQEGSSVFREIIDSTVMPEKLTRRLPVTERKESAPVHRVTSKDKDSKMSRSTSENFIKIKKSEPHSVSPKTPTKITDHRRPNKCFATKSINLSATDRLVSSEDMANIVIDIQHAKSSREPSPDKIVPTPVPANLDTGKPRYPDVVQEPEDDQPKRKPQVKNIPIFEEENNSYVGCHITEVNVEKGHKTTYDSLDYEKEILKNPVVEAPSSLDYISLEKTSEDESLLTVHEKVTKFQNITTDNVNKKSKTEQPFQPGTPHDINIKPQYDEYIVAEKIEKVKEEKNEDDYEFSRTEYDLATTKLAPTAPQKSPELVRTISRHISRQTEPDLNNEANEDYALTTHNDDSMECLRNNRKTTKEFKVSHQHLHHQQHYQTTTETETANTAGKYQQPQEYNDHDDDDDNELIPHTATHTTIIEERRQKDILSRPSVFENRNNKTTTTTVKTPLKCNKSPVKETEILRPDIKSRTKPTYAENNKLAEQNTQATTKTKPKTTTTTTTTKTVTELSNKPKQHSPQRKNTDFDYELRDCNVETGIKNIISKQTKVYNNNNDDGSDSKANDFKKSTTNNKKPEKHMSVRLTAAKNSDAYESSADNEMIITTVEKRNDTDIETQVVNEEETNRRQTSQKKQFTEEVHSSTDSSPTTTDQSLKANIKKVHVDKLTDKNSFRKSNTPVTTTSTSIKINETIERADHIDETVLEPTTKKSPSAVHPSAKGTKMSTTVTDSVAARRSLFENNNGNSGPSTTHTKRTPLSSPMSGRRPSYMDHTKSSLEHTRRDSLEINKSNYLRKPSHPEQEGEEMTVNDRNSMVKFVDVPHGKRATTPRATSVSEDINVEEIFDLEVLEKLLETVQSYEIRRRIRAQIRLIKKNQRNEMISSSTTEVTTSSVRTSKMDNEEPDTVTRNNRKPKLENKTGDEITEAKEVTSQKSTKKEYIFEEAYHPTTRRSPKPKRYPYEEQEDKEQLKEPARKPIRSQSPQSPERQRSAAERERHNSPDHQQDHNVKVQQQHHKSRTTKQQFHYHSEQEQEDVSEIKHETSPNRKSPSPTRKLHSSSISPERRYTSPAAKTSERNRSPQTKTPQNASRIPGSRSPDNKTSATAVRKTSASYDEQQETVKSSNNKIQTKRITPTTTTTTTATTTTKAKPEDKTPVWADRKNILKAAGSVTTPKKPSSSTLDTRTGYTKTMKSTTSQKMMTSSHQTSFVDDDCVTSSYGIGPTDENGLPLFGIRALKKKKSPVEPSETTEVTGYVVEEKYYSDNKTKPTVERKELIYSTNPEQLQKLKQHVEVTNHKKSLKDVELKESRQAALISKTTPALRSSPEDDFLDSTTKYVRRGSVKEMSEKFIQKEASSTVTEKSNNYPKAGLILRTNSRKSSRDQDNENNEQFESYKTSRVQQHHTSSALADSDDAEQEYEVEEFASHHHSGRFVTESESECDSIKTQREFKKVTSSSSSSMATRSFLNSQGEEKVVTNVSDCLERMRNADNVVEEGDTAEDQEARALLNKFLGASIIMKGVESSVPATNRQTKITTTTTTSSSLSDNNDEDDDNGDGDNNAKHEVKTTRITKTIKSGSSSTPVTDTTCDIEEIWDEEILKELLEQARTYEERRKIRSRLRELMADREETKKSPKGEEKEKTTAASAPALAAASKAEAEANVANNQEEESSASEYEEIIEEVTDYSEAESEVDESKQITKKSQNIDKTSEADVTETKEKSKVSVTTKSEISSAKQEAKTVIETVAVEEIVEQTSVEKSVDKTDSSEKGESITPMVHSKPQNILETMPQETVMHSSNQSTNSQKLKTPQISGNHNSKITVNESSSMHASHNNSNNNKAQKVISATSNSHPNPIMTIQTPSRADSTSSSNKNNKNNTSSSSSNSARRTNSNTNNNNDSSSGSGSLGGSSVVVGSSDSGSRQIDRLGVPQKEDSGTESGEDLRLIAAGLRDQLQIQSDSNIIEDVTCALSRLENSLKEGKDISVDTEKRKALLALVARLRAGLTSPEKLAEIAAAMSELDGNVGPYSETSSPEADAHRTNRSRFGKRKNRVNRHTVGVSREELADARRYMEDMILMSNICASTTPEANITSNNAPPQWYPLEKNASTGAILTQSLTPVLQRPKQFVPEANANMTYTNRMTMNNGKRRPLSGEYSVSFENSIVSEEPNESYTDAKQGSYSEDNSKGGSRFTNKKYLMKRANTIDLAHKYHPECDTDSEAEDKGPKLGLKRTVQVSVKKRVQNVVPPFEPKTENDRKFLAFINKQSDKPGLGWTTSRSVSNWTNKFGSIKNTFEGGLVGKPPLAPQHHVSSNLRPNPIGKAFTQPGAYNAGPVQQAPNYITNQQIASRLQREAERQAEERRRKLEREHLEYERREREKLERQRQQHERQERERLEHEHFERQRREQDQLTAAHHAAIRQEQEQLAAAQLAAANMPQPIPINEFKHAPQSVFRPIDSGEVPVKAIYKPIPQFARNASNWQSVNAVPTRPVNSPGQYGNTRPDNSFITSPPPSSRSPLALPWASKPTVDSSSFKSKAHRFEERSKYDNINTSPFIQRHNSLRSSNDTSNQMSDEFRKRPSLPNAFDPYSARQMSLQQDPLAYLPPPQNISFTYSSLKPKTTYQSYPCLPLAVVSNSHENGYQRLREDSLTDPNSVPLVLTSSNPLYCPTSQSSTQQQHQPIVQTRLPRQYELVSPANSTPQNDYTDDDLDSENNLLEYHAVSRVMGKPQSQTAVTVGRRTGHVSDDELYGKNSRAARNLLSTMKSLGNAHDMRRPKAPVTKRPEAVTSPKTCLSPDGRSYQAPIVEPLFPEINKFEANRKPLYTDESKNQPSPRNQVGMYKSMENLSRSTAKSKTQFTQQSSSKPYVSETQTSYVVTYPIEDTTDDEDFSRINQTKMMPPNSLDVRRHRNVSENSTASSTTTSMSFGQNLPSPNTNWTSNPIVLDESNNYQNMSTPYQNGNKNVSTSSAGTNSQAVSNQVTTSYSSANQNYHSPPTDYKKMASESESSSQRNVTSMSAKQQASAPQLAKRQTQETTTLNSQSSNGATSQNQYQRQQQSLQQNSTIQKQLPQQAPKTKQPKSTEGVQKPADYPKQISSKTVTSTSTRQETKTMANMRSKTEDHYSMQASEQTAINPKNSNISQEMLMRLDQQRERISKEIRRKSLGNTLDYEMEKQARYETQNSQAYKSSAPPDTPDIVKSSLPKDETQPILKKFGPPQRHHYMPNSYQSPSAKTTSTSVVTATSVQHSTKNVHSTAKQTVVKTSKTSQQVFSNCRPTVMETPATPQPDDDYIPRNIVFNNIHAFSSMSQRRQEDESSSTNVEQHHTIRPSKLSKSDSWNQIMMLQNRQAPNNATKFNQSPTNELRRTKSGHTLALPKMFEAAITKTEIGEKQKTVAAYFSGQKSPTQQEIVMEQQQQQQQQQLQQSTKRSVINRTKTTEKVSAASRKSLGSNLPIVLGNLQRSATMPHIANLNLLDESNVEDAFEQLIMEQKQQKSSSSTTEKTETKEKDGAVVTTTTKVTTRTVTGSAAKPVTPFAKFKQLDKQNSQQSAKSPTTPTTPGGGSTASPSSGNQPIFKFTDPALNAKAATVKEQLLQWCQSKTQEYENIEITNFSTSWNNGLAFCALIHHFLPDAFDYSQLTPKNRRKNFELAFTVADEKAGIAPLLDVEDMVVMQRPDWKCVFVYVQSIYRRFRNCQ